MPVYEKISWVYLTVMKAVIVVSYLIFTAIVGYGQEYWLEKPSPTTKWFYDCFLVDTLYGWASGDSGMIVHTSNGGQNWVLQSTGIVFPPVENLFFLNRNIGWGIANDYLFYGTIILRTTNGGINWTNYRFPDTTVVINTVHFLDSQTGFMSGYTGRIFKTINGGQNWNEMFVDTAYCPQLYIFPKTRFNFINSQTGFVCGGQRDIQGMIWRTSNGGANWYTYCVSAEPLVDIKAINSTKVISCGGDPEYGATFGYTQNGGLSWTNITPGFFGIATRLAFRTPAELWLPLSIEPSWAVSLDSGNFNTQWQIIPTPDSSRIYAAQFVTPTYGWAFGYGGVILKYNVNVIGISGQNNNFPVKNLLYQNYPNPFNPSTMISYYLSRQEFVKITIYDLQGREVMRIIEGIKQQGTHRYNFISNGFASGVYIYKISAGKFTDTKKMVILK